MTEHKSHSHQPKRPFRQARWLLATVAVLVLLPCLGLMGSVAYLKARQAGALSQWRSLGVAPDSAVDIVTGDTDVVYVRTAAGSTYGCRHTGTGAADNCWYKAQEPLSVNPEATFDKRLYQSEVEPPPGRVADRLEVTIWLAEDAFETRYVLLEDGTLWKWEYDVGSYWNLLILLIGPALGLGLAIVVVAVLWVALRLRTMRAA